MSTLAYRTILDAVANNNLLEVHHLHATGTLLNASMSAHAASHGCHDILKWLHLVGCPWDERTCANAARFGHFNILRWARANGCPWDEYTCLDAAAKGHLAMLQWARANGCTWIKDACLQWALGLGHTETAMWITSGAGDRCCLTKSAAPRH